jgi:hypothetical protein
LFPVINIFDPEADEVIAKMAPVVVTTGLYDPLGPVVLLYTLDPPEIQTLHPFDDIVAKPQNAPAAPPGINCVHDPPLLLE